METYAMATHSSANLSLQERNRQRQILDGSRTEPTTYDQSHRQTGIGTHQHHLPNKKLQY